MEYKLFTHGLLFTHGGWDRDPIIDYLMEWGPEHVPVVIDLPKRVIFGMECKDERGRHRSDWCYKLLAVRHEGWDELFDWMSLIGAIDRDHNYVARLLAQEIPVPDVLALEKTIALPKSCPMVDVAVFGVDSNKHAAFVEPAKAPPIDKPKVRVVPPDPETVDLMTKVLSNHDDPYQDADRQYQQIKIGALQKVIEKTQKLIV